MLGKSLVTKQAPDGLPVNSVYLVEKIQIEKEMYLSLTLDRAAGTLDQHRGISPWQRTSGIDGLTVDGGNSVIDLEVDLQIVEVSE